MARVKKYVIRVLISSTRSQIGMVIWRIYYLPFSSEVKNAWSSMDPLPHFHVMLST